MSIIPKLASQQGRKDEEPNKNLGKMLVESDDLVGIQEAAENLANDDRKIVVDCLGVLEQVGALAPELIQEYHPQFLELAFSNDNRLVWQSLINLAMIAELQADKIMQQQGKIMELVEGGSVITRDNGIKVLARAGSASKEYTEMVFPFLIDQLNTCRPKSVPQYAESIKAAVNSNNKQAYLKVLQARMTELSPAQEKRVRKLIKALD